MGDSKESITSTQWRTNEEKNQKQNHHKYNPVLSRDRAHCQAPSLYLHFPNFFCNCQPLKMAGQVNRYSLYPAQLLSQYQ
jgi:hypothetical protein